MANNSAIEWCDTTWNPLAGCTWASSGCDRCYAAVMARRLEAMALADIKAGRDPGGKRKYIGITNKNKAGRIMFNGVVNLDPFALGEPRRWKKPRRVFVNSMSDLFHKDVPDAFIGKVWDAMARAHQHIFQVLTKRPERMAELVPQFAARHTARDGTGWPLANIWCGTSVESQAAADERIPWLLRVPATVRFLSCEPLLGQINLDHYLIDDWTRIGDDVRYHTPHPALHWIITGGESGPGARPMHPNWARSLRDQARAAGVAFLFKQWGEYVHADDCPVDSHKGASLFCAAGTESTVTLYKTGKHAAGRLLDGVEHNGIPS